MKLKLTPKQTEDLPFPIGCPVWYNFPEKSSSGGEESKEELPLLKQGVVESVSFSYGTKDIIYEVVYKDDAGDENGHIVDEVSQHDLAYAANCPVTVRIGHNGEDAEGTILLCEPSSSDTGKFSYTVLMWMEGSQARFESGIDAKHVRYRKVKAGVEDSDEPKTAAATPAPATVPRERPSSTDNDHSKDAPALAVRKDEETVPSSITYDSIATSNSKDRGTGSNSNKRKHTIPDIFSAPKRKLDTTPTNNNAHYKYHDSRRSISSYSHDSVSSSWGTGNHETWTEMKIPVWLQRDYCSQRNLFFHLIGSRDQDKKGKRTVGDVHRETNCSIRVNFNNRSPSSRDDAIIPTAPITLTIDARSRTPLALRDLDLAREKIQELLLDYMDAIHDDGAKGRLMYEVASSCRGEHRPSDSTSRAVRVNGSFLSLVELPYSSRDGRFHASYLLKNHILVRVKERNCKLRVCGDDFRVPLKFCNPHLTVTGRHWQDVDHAVEIVKDAIGTHMRMCSCAL